MRRVFLAWVGSIDPALRSAIRESLTPWLGTSLAALALILTAGVLPGTASYFRLDVPAALTVWALTSGVGIALAWLDQRIDYPPLVYGIALILSSTSVLFLAACLAALSKPPGSLLFSAVFLFTAGFYGHVHRSSLRYPFGIIMVLGALGGALLLDRSPDTLRLFSVVAPAAVGGNWLLGTLSLRAHRERVRSDSFKAAVQAQILDETSRDVSRLSDAMLHVLQTTHDASNALSTALINAELLRKASEARNRGEPTPPDEHETTEDLARQLVRLRQLVEETREVGHAGGDRLETLQSVAPLPVISVVLRDLRVRFPAVDFGSSGPESSIGVIVSGGVESLRRMLENLVLNACQGDGQRGARRVEVTVEEAPTVGSVAIRVSDDGPGFGVQQLARPITGFQSTKKDGTGLGLYTTERLVRASGGSLARSNGERGGAEVTIFLRSAAPT